MPLVQFVGSSFADEYLFVYLWKLLMCVFYGRDFA